MASLLATNIGSSSHNFKLFVGLIYFAIKSKAIVLFLRCCIQSNLEQKCKFR